MDNAPAGDPMVAIPENTVTMDDLIAWYKAKDELAKWKNIEALLRPKLFRHFFPDPEEGTNTYVLPDGYQVKGIRTISREIDPGAWTALVPQFQEKKINAEALIKRKPELIISEYRKLTAEEIHLVDQALIIKDGMPSLEIKPPAKKKT